VEEIFPDNNSEDEYVTETVHLEKKN